MTFLTAFLIYLGIAFIAFLWLLFGDLLEIRSLGDFALMIVAVLLWPVILVFNIYKLIYDKIHKS